MGAMCGSELSADNYPPKERYLCVPYDVEEDDETRPVSPQRASRIESDRIHVMSYNLLADQYG